MCSIILFVYPCVQISFVMFLPIFQVDREGLVRKQSLHILKKTMLMNEDIKSSSSISNKISCNKSSIPSGIKKKDAWAEKEAKSLGVGQLSSSLDSSLGKLEKWQAFLLLYEMLEEYGTHLVEAAWDHQVSFHVFIFLCLKVK